MDVHLLVAQIKVASGGGGCARHHAASQQTVSYV